MVRQGDWIEMPSHNADGTVLDVSLTTVKVQNWDKTITTVPTYALVAEPFKNWRGMDESGGRRIKRAMHLDVTSVRFCDAEMLERFKKIQCISDFVERKLAEVSDYNRDHEVDESLLVNGRHLTNVGTFRAYLEHYLRSHPKVHQDMTFLVRQLPPTEHGLPIEIYVFSNDQAWVSYEAIQADIFDHVLAALPLFDLRPFQAPTRRGLAGVDGRSSLVMTAKLRDRGRRLRQPADRTKTLITSCGVVSSSSMAQQHQMFVNFMTLVRMDEAYELEPYLARSWDWDDDMVAGGVAMSPSSRRLRCRNSSRSWSSGTGTKPSSRGAFWTMPESRVNCLRTMPPESEPAGLSQTRPLSRSWRMMRRRRARC